MALLVGDSLRTDYYNVDFSDVDDVDGNSEEWDDGDVEDVLQGLFFLENFVSGASFDESAGRSDHGDDDDYNGGTYLDLDSDYYAPYVTTLPSKPVINTNNKNDYDNEEGLTPDFWSESTINEIGIPSYTQQILNRKRIIQTMARNNNVNERDLQWATFLIRSRRFTTWNMVPDPNEESEGAFGGAFTQKKVEQIQGFLVPLIDMANHSPNPNAVMKISVNKWTRKFDESSSFALRATRPIKKGEEITISYGDGTSTCLELLDKYGFFVENDEDGANERGVDLDELGPIWGTSVEEDEVELDRLRGGSMGAGKDSSSSSTSSSKLKTIVSRLQDEYIFNFPPTLLDNEQMKLIGSGIREKLGINIYAVGMYGSPSLLDAVSPSDLRYKAKQFDDSSSSETGTSMTSFVLEMILQAEGKVIAEAISDSVGVRYVGSRADIEQLDYLINDGISGKGGQANKGTTLRFDCTKEGVSLSVDGVHRGMVKASSLGKAFVDVYLDNNAVSPSLIDSCIENSSIAKSTMNENANEGDTVGSASRRTMLSLRIWLKRLKKWTKPEEESSDVAEIAVSDVGTVSVEASDGGGTGFVSDAQGAEQLSADSKLDSSDDDTTGEVEEIVTAISDEAGSESTSDECSPDDVAAVEPTDIESTVIAPALEEAIEEEPAAVAQPPEATIFAVSSKNIDDIESKLGSGLTDKATSVSFQPKLDDGLYLAGVGVRKKAIINVYAVAMYSSPSTLASVATLSKGKDAQAALRDSARSFGPATPATSFVLEMTFKADGKTIGEAIGEGVKPRYSGPETDVKQLESLIIEGVKSKGGQATKGTIFRFDCTKDGISVSVDGVPQGQVVCDGIGSALVDVFTDNNAVSQQLVDSSLSTWCGSGLVLEPVQTTLPPVTNQDLGPKSAEPARTGLPEVATLPPLPTQVADESDFDKHDIAARIRELEAEIAAEIIRVKSSQKGATMSDVTSSLAGDRSAPPDAGANSPVVDEKAAAVEPKVKSLKEKATGVLFDPKLEDGLYLVGCGVRKKAIINVYAVAMYSSATAIASLGSTKKGKDAQSALRDSSRTFNSLTTKTSFVLEMTFKADGKTIAEAIADGVKPRYGGPAAAVTELENLIVEGVKSKGGQATKGTIFRFDCDAEGVAVSVDGNMQGRVASEGMGSALVDVFVDDKAVSPQLVDSCMNTWCGSGL